jgi:hypothetical protein
MGHVHSLAIHRQRKSAGPHFLGDRHRLNAGRSMRRNRKRENKNKERAKTRQQANPSVKVGTHPL